MSDVDAVRAAVRPGETKLVWVETPTNPLLNIGDIEALAPSPTTRARCSSSTTPSPRRTSSSRSPSAPTSSCTPRRSTAAATPTSSAAPLVVRDLDGGRAVAFHQNSIGAVAGPFDAWLVLRGLKTLAVRMDRHCDNAERVVDFLPPTRTSARSIYPGLAEHPGHAIACRQMKRYGGIVSFRVKGGEQPALDVCDRAEVFTLGESLGGVESLIEHPGRMTHASVAGTDLEVPADLIRLSVGIETVEDLLADLDQALPVEGRERASLETPVAVCVDFGSTFTKAALVDVATGDCSSRRPATARRSTPTCSTAGTPAWPSWRRRPRAARRRGARLLLGRRGAADRGRRQRGAGHRRGRPSGRAVERRPGRARRARRVERDGLRALRAEPDVVLLVGGTDGGNAEVLLACADALARARWPGPVVVAGNVDAQAEVAALLDGAGTPYVLADNVVPQIGVLAPGSARPRSARCSCAHVIGGKHLSARRTSPRWSAGATPGRGADRRRAARARAGRRAPGRGDVVVVDVGGATTDVHSRGRGRPRGAGLGPRGGRHRAGQPDRRGRPRHALERRPHGRGGAGGRPRRRRRGCVPPPAYDAPTRRSCRHDEAEAGTTRRSPRRRWRLALRRHAGRSQVGVSPGGPRRRAQRQGPARGRPAGRLGRGAAQQPGRGRRAASSGRSPGTTSRAAGSCREPRGRSSTTTTCSPRPACSPRPPRGRECPVRTAARGQHIA